MTRRSDKVALALPDLASIDQVAKSLSLSESSIKKLIKLGELRPVKVLAAVRIPRGDVERLIERGLTRTA